MEVISTEKLIKLLETFHEINCHVLQKVNKIIVFFYTHTHIHTSGDTFVT